MTQNQNDKKNSSSSGSSSESNSSSSSSGSSNQDQNQKKIPQERAFKKQARSQSVANQNDKSNKSKSSQEKQQDIQWKQQQVGFKQIRNPSKFIDKKIKSDDLMSQDNDQEIIVPKRGNDNNFNPDSFKNFNPKFIADQQGQHNYETRDQNRRGGFGDRGGRGRGRGGGFGDRGDFNGRGYRGGRGGGFEDRGAFIDRGGYGVDRGGYGDRGGRGRGRGGLGNRGGFSNNRSFNDRSQNDSYKNGDFGQQRHQNNNNAFGYNLRSSNANSFNNNNNMNNPIAPLQQQIQGTTNTVPQQFNPAMLPPGYFPYMVPPAGQLTSAFKKKNIIGQQDMISSKVSKIKDKKSKKKHKSKKSKNYSSSSQSDSVSSSSDSGSDTKSKASQALQMSMFISNIQQNKKQSSRAQKDIKKRLQQRRKDKRRFQQVKPQGRKAWPSSCLNVLGNTFQITYRNINQHSNCALIIPYEDTSMNIYPGTIVNKSQIDYREKIQLKRQTLIPGTVYNQDNWLSKQFLYHCIGFVKIDQEIQSVENGLKFIFETYEAVQRKFAFIQRLVIPLSMFKYQNNNYEKFMKKIVSLMGGKKFKQVILTTKDKQEWEKAMLAFVRISLEMIEKNEIGI